jgi:hypothetical protein
MLPGRNATMSGGRQLAITHPAQWWHESCCCDIPGTGEANEPRLPSSVPAM